MSAAHMHNYAAQDARDAPLNAPEDVPVARTDAQLVMSIDGFYVTSDPAEVRTVVQALATAQGFTPEMITAVDLQVCPPLRSGGQALVFLACASEDATDMLYPLPEEENDDSMRVLAHEGLTFRVAYVNSAAGDACVRGHVRACPR